MPRVARRLRQAIKASPPGRRRQRPEGEAMEVIPSPGRRWKSDLPDLGDLDRIGHGSQSTQTAKALPTAVRLDSSDEEDEKSDHW